MTWQTLQGVPPHDADRLRRLIAVQAELSDPDLGADAVMHRAISRALELTAAPGAEVQFIEGDEIVIAASIGFGAERRGNRFPVRGNPINGCLARSAAESTSDASVDPRCEDSVARVSGIRSLVTAPITQGGRIIGGLQIHSAEPDAFSAADERTVELLAGFAGSAMDRASTSSRLEASERRTRAVIESAPYPIVIFDTDTAGIVEFNAAAEVGFGWSRAEALGKPATMLLPNRHVEAFSRWLQDGRKAGTQIYAGRSFETTGRKADGTEFPIEVAVVDLPEETRLAGAFIRDVSLRYRLRESLERLASVVAGTPVILLACDVEGMVTLSEGKGLTAFGLSPGDTAGHNLRDLLEGEADALEHLDRALRGESFSGLIHLAGPDVFFEANYSPIRNDGGVMTGVSVMLTDVSDRIHAEAAKRESDAKSRLMAMMNHEVRTPLNSILGFATLLSEARAGALNDQQRHYLANIEAAGRQLLELVNESLDLAKLKAGHMAVELRSLSADDAMVSAADEVRPMAENGRVALLIEPAPPVMVRADRGRLTHVLLNLLSNAIRHTPPGGKVTLSSSVEGQRGIIRVADNGQGIAREDLVHIFEEFYQARNHAPGGTGLGLTIARRLVEEMGGTIEVASEVGVGSTFTVNLGRGEVEPSQS